MKKSWSSEPQQILEELVSLVNSKVPVMVFYRKNTAPVKTVLHQVDDGNGHLVLQRPAGWKDSKKNYVLYKKKDQPTRGFALLIQEKSESQLAGSIPQEIFQINQRRHTRVEVPDTAKASLKLEGGQDENICQVKDLSLSGVSLCGCPPSGIQEDDEVGPITLTLPVSDYDSEVVDIVIPKASVVRVGKDDEGETLVGLSYRLDGDTQEQVHQYLDLRIWEAIQFEE